MLNESSATERASTQAILIIFVSVGQLLGAAMIGALTNSVNNGTVGYSYAFTVMSGIALLLVFASGFLKSRKTEHQNQVRD
jgi:MFS family permease